MAFLRGRSTVDAHLRLRDIVDGLGEKYVLAIFVDIADAFDSMWWLVVLRRLREIGLDSNTSAVINIHARKRIISNNWESIERFLERGVPQGSVLGPLLWIILFCMLVTRVGVGRGRVAYVDDMVVLVAEDSRREIEQCACIVLAAIHEWCVSQKIRIAVAKTRALLLKGSLVRDPSIRFFEERVTVVPSFVWLGICIDKGWTCLPHL